MRKHFPTLLATLVYTAIYGSHAQADLAQQCMVGIPIYQRTVVKDDFESLPVKIESDHSIATYPSGATFAGNVTLAQGNRRLTADQVHLEQSKSADPTNPERTVTATGNVNYDDNLVQLSGNKAWSNLNTKNAEIFESQYQLMGRQGRGSADKIALRDNRYIVMDNGTFTSCLPSDNSWSIVGSEIIQDNEEQLAEIWHARFKIGSVPIFYSPYLQIPTGNKRRSGFLLPEIDYSNTNGVQIGLPYYWNIAPNVDATLTPNFIAERGFQWRNELRYLFGLGQGLFELDWLASDRRYDRDYTDDKDSNRWLFHWQHGGILNNVWRFNVNYTKVSDNQYLNDLDTPYGESTDGYISQKYSVGYANKYWDTSLKVKQFQVFTDGGNVNAYRAFPQFDVTNYLYSLGPFNLQTYGQIARFMTESEHNPKVTRLHFEPVLSMPIYERWGTLNAEVRLLSTHFQQDIPNSFAADYLARTGNYAPELKDSVNRVLPKYKINGKLVFDRDMDWLANYTQTLEPRFQYLYVPYKDQSNIYIYDTTILQSDYAGLFRDRLYSGLDRVASANQLTTGVTSRIYDDKLEERFNFSVGQIYYFEPSRTGDEEFIVNRKESTGSRVWAADSFWKVNEQFSARGGIQYDDRLGNVSLGDMILEYRYNTNTLLQLSYRYASKEYVSAMIKGIDRSSTVYQQNISQVGAVTSFPITDNWAAVAAYYYDPKLKQTNDALVGLQYSNCCWGFNAAFERKIVDWNKDNNQRSDYDNKFSFNIELRGLSGTQNVSTSKMLRRNILPYQRAF